MRKSECSRKPGTAGRVKLIFSALLVLAVGSLFVVAEFLSRQPAKQVPVAAEDESAVAADTGAEPWEDADRVPKLKVLVITPDVDKGYAAGIRELFERCGLQAEVADPKKATVEFANAFDVLVVTGLNRYPKQAAFRSDYTKPVVAYGPCGCGYLGSLKLKPGWPYT